MSLSGFSKEVVLKDGFHPFFGYEREISFSLTPCVFHTAFVHFLHIHFRYHHVAFDTRAKGFCFTPIEMMLESDRVE